MNLLPTYPLAEVQRLVAAGRFRVTLAALNGAGAMCFRESDIRRCVLALTLGDFHKTMEAKARPGFWQDVYRPRYRGKHIYLKVQLEGTSHDDIVVVVQFKESTAV